jgi:DNA-directed RNA polymerase specialized sigma24 family protein
MSEVEDTIMANKEHNKRLDILYRKHHKWLSKCAYNICKDSYNSEELVSELYIYLASKQKPSIYYADSFNLMYCRTFLSSRYLNQVKRSNKVFYVENPFQFNDREKNLTEYETKAYETQLNNSIDESYDKIIEEINKLKQIKKMWSSAQIYEYYAFGDYTLDQLATQLKLSKSTVFLAVRKVKSHLKENVKNPFIKDIEIY